MNKDEHEFRVKEKNRLQEKFEMRGELKSKLYYTYPRLFEGLYDLLSLSETVDFVFAFQQHFTDGIIQAYPNNNDDIVLNFWLEPNINYSLLIQETFDDYWASFLCFSHGFTKQSIEILRNTYELILVLCYLKFCNKDDEKMVIWLANWLEGKSGVPNAELMIRSLKKTEFLREENGSSYLNLWHILCAATHSQKKMMTSMTAPAGLWIRDKKMFEEFSVVQTRAIFLLVVETELKMMKCFFENEQGTQWKPKILNTLTQMQRALERYAHVIDNIKKGYLIHKQQIKLASGKTVLFSLGINNEPKLVGKVTLLTRDEQKDLNSKVIELLQAMDVT